MMQHHIRQTHLFDGFDEAPPLKVKTPCDGFVVCPTCHGVRIQLNPRRSCDQCRGLGNVLAA